jgi:hypothetical protein
MDFPSILTLIIACGLFLLAKYTKFDFSTLRTRELRVHHSCRRDAAWEDLEIRLSMEEADTTIFVSSAYSTGSTPGIDFSILGRSFIYNKKRTGPRTEPWRTPTATSFGGETNVAPFLYRTTD